MYCTKCGTKNSGKGLFCKNCGASLVEEMLKSDYEEKDYSNNRVNKTKNINKTVNKTINKNIEKNKRNKEKNNKNDREVQIIHKTSAFQKMMILVLILIIIILSGGLVIAGLYIFQDKTVEVPNVVGTNYEQATIVLENTNLKVRIKKIVVDNELKNDIVLKQSKYEGEFVRKNSYITLTVGKYENNKLDNFIGLTKKKAISKLKKLKIKYDIKEVESLESDGIVISQTPTQGSTYDSNTLVTLSITKKKEEKEEVSDDEKTIIEQDEEEIDSNIER